MRSKIEATWVVGYERGQHTLLRDAEVVFEGNTILHVGKAFEGRVDRVIDAKDKLVSPGFIDTHVHSGHRASHRLITDTGRPMYYGQPFLEISVPKQGKVVQGDPRYLKHGDKGSAAAFEGRLEVVRLLLGRGAGREGALFAAVLGRRGEVARELLPLGWDRGELRQAARVHREVSEAVPEADEELGRLLRSAWRAAEREPDA